MIAADTNLVLRLILQDDDTQLATVQGLMAEYRLYLPLTVVMEAGWVLASRYQMKRGDIADAFMALLVLDGVEIARADLVAWAVDRFRSGADWADMLHLVAARKLEGFVTFDQRLSHQAGGAPPVAVTTLR